MIHRAHPKLLCTQDSSLSSDSTKSTICTKQIVRQKKENRRRSVSFDKRVIVVEDTNYSKEERKAMFYTRGEMQAFPRRTLRCLHRVQRRLAKGKGSSPTSASKSSDTVIGLESFLHPEQRRKHRLQGVLSVLMEQDRQYRELGYFTPTDFDSMSYYYHVASQESRDEAYQRAKSCHLGSYKSYE